MRRLLTWYLPLIAGIAISALFAWGFVRGVAGDAGEIVRDSSITGSSVESGVEPAGARAAVENELVVILGDSLARGTGDELGEGIGGRLSEILDDREREHEIANLAVNGSTTEDLLAQLERPSVSRLLSEASLVIVSIGGNDFFGERDMFGITESVPENPEEVIASIQERIVRVVANVRAINSNAPIFVLGLYNPFSSVPDGSRLSPVVARWNGSLLERFSDDPRVVVVQTSDLFLERDRLSADRFHPNGEAYGLIARRIADAL